MLIFLENIFVKHVRYKKNSMIEIITVALKAPRDEDSKHIHSGNISFLLKGKKSLES